MLYNDINLAVKLPYYHFLKGNQGMVKTYISYILIFSFHDAHSFIIDVALHSVYSTIKKLITIKRYYLVRYSNFFSKDMKATFLIYIEPPT